MRKARHPSKPGHAVVQVQDEFTLQLLLKAEHLGRTESGSKRYEYDTCFGPNASQDEVYRETNALIQSAFDGYNICVFAYGQVGQAVLLNSRSGCPHDANACQ